MIYTFNSLTFEFDIVEGPEFYNPFVDEDNDWGCDCDCDCDSDCDSECDSDCETNYESDWDCDSVSEDPCN